ncbi:MFS transporter [Spirulina sp. 06S082]|uniref:MFS transporter n=1 Tax=Spirulina sp. 06S082 TaxID=3110248 RepID=UPI002B20DF76|nr:MFS transporter [Spirulina sp. 06S082]MEA5471030.1 MFS transporter [Spirulina sp. 06S082]
MEFTWRDRSLFVLLATGSLIVMTGAVIAPILPEIIAQLHLDRTLAGYLVSTHYLTVALFSPILGLLADRFGQVKVLVISLVFYALFGMAGGLMNGFIPLLITRGLVGAASGGIAAASLGLLVKRYESAEARALAIAYVSSVLAIANIIYPISAGLLGLLGWRVAFWLYGLAIPFALLVIFVFEQPEKSTTSAQSLSSMGGDSQELKKVISNPLTWQLFLTLAFTAATAYGVVINLPIHLKATINSGTAINGIALASQAIGSALVSAFGVRKLARRLGLVPATALGFGIVALVLVAIPQFDRLYLFLSATILLGVGFGIVMPNIYTLLSNLTSLELQSTILAAGTGTNFLGQFFAPALFGFLLGDRPLYQVFYIAAIVPLLLGFLLMFTAKINLSKR